ncbi:MAG: hypothetical protein ACRDRI_21525 [Pseudonocardiaceae bacterium]
MTEDLADVAERHPGCQHLAGQRVAKSVWARIGNPRPVAGSGEHAAEAPVPARPRIGANWRTNTARPSTLGRPLCR